MSKSKKKKVQKPKKPEKKKKVVKDDPLHDFKHDVEDYFPDIMWSSKKKGKEPTEQPQPLVDEEEFDPWWSSPLSDSEQPCEETSQGLSLGARIGTISMLEKMPSESVPSVVSKAGLTVKLVGACVSLTEEGAPLSLDELKELANWFLKEIAKASEAYEVEI